jgi:hypothetical protein
MGIKTFPVVAFSPKTGSVTAVINKSLQATLIRYGVQQLYNRFLWIITKIVNELPMIPAMIKSKEINN